MRKLALLSFIGLILVACVPALVFTPTPTSTPVPPTSTMTPTATMPPTPIFTLTPRPRLGDWVEIEPGMEIRIARVWRDDEYADAIRYFGELAKGAQFVIAEAYWRNTSREKQYRPSIALCLNKCGCHWAEDSYADIDWEKGWELYPSVESRGIAMFEVPAIWELKSISICDTHSSPCSCLCSFSLKH